MNLNILVLTTLFLIASSEILPFDKTAIDKIFQEKKPGLILFATDNQNSNTARQALQAFDQSGKAGEVVLSITQPNDGKGLYSRLSEYLGVDTSNTPSFVYLSEKQEKYLFDGELTQQSLEGFIAKANAGQVEVYWKSSPIPQTNDEPVKVAVGKSFKQLVLQSEKQVLVKFYAPWCGHCVSMAPHYAEVARRLQANPNILLVKVDATENEVPGLQINGFPTLKFWGKDKSKGPIDYDGGRQTNEILQWLKEHTEYEWVDYAAGKVQQKKDEETVEEVNEEL